jgi:hypothetical protein
MDFTFTRAHALERHAIFGQRADRAIRRCDVNQWV